MFLKVCNLKVLRELYLSDRCASLIPVCRWQSNKWQSLNLETIVYFFSLSVLSLILAIFKQWLLGKDTYSHILWLTVIWPPVVSKIFIIHFNYRFSGIEEKLKFRMFLEMLLKNDLACDDASIHSPSQVTFSRIVSAFQTTSPIYASPGSHKCVEGLPVGIGV